LAQGIDHGTILIQALPQGRVWFVVPRQNGVRSGVRKDRIGGGMVGMENFRYRALGKEDEDPN
jgi:hypothetical protein